MSASYTKGDNVKWKWGDGYARGKVVERHTKTIEQTIDGNSVKRKGDDDNAALVIEQDDGQKVLKLESEVSKDTSNS